MTAPDPLQTFGYGESSHTAGVLAGFQLPDRSEATRRPSETLRFGRSSAAL